MSTPLAPVLEDWHRLNRPAILVTIRETRGSTPREVGATMLVSGDETAGSIGGGHLEWRAMQQARAMLTNAKMQRETLALTLGPESGQCCGGFVRLDLVPATAETLVDVQQKETAERQAWPLVAIFGAGHVGQALAQALAPLPFRLCLIDSRADIQLDPTLSGLDLRLGANPLAQAEALPAGSAGFVMTHDHGLDSLLCAALLERDDIAYLGLIGSRSKRKRFETAWRMTGLSSERVARLTCPIGGSESHDKRPAVIAALATAELINSLAKAQQKVARQWSAA
jgi:xanthine dehydrogenase accessory factor